jgi:HEAT repeat protein
VRLAIARSLFRLGEQERAIEALVEELLHASAGFVRYQAARALEQIGPPARRALPAIMSSLGDPDATVRGLIVRALATIGGDIPTVVLWIVTGLDDEVETVRASAAAALGQLGPRAFQAIECLKREVVEGTPAVRFAASSALWHICRWRHAVDVAVEALQSAHPSLRSAAACLLHEMRPAAKPAVGALLAALHDDDRWVREDAAQAIQEIEADTGRWN